MPGIYCTVFIVLYCSGPGWSYVCPVLAVYVHRTDMIIPNLLSSRFSRSQWTWVRLRWTWTIWPWWWRLTACAASRTTLASSSKTRARRCPFYGSSSCISTPASSRDSSELSFAISECLFGSGTSNCWNKSQNRNGTKPYSVLLDRSSESDRVLFLKGGKRKKNRQ